MKGSPHRLTADLLLASIALIWGSTFIIVKRALDDMSPTVFLAVRFSLAAVLLAIVFRGKWFPEKAARPVALRAGIFCGLSLIAGYVFQTVGLAYTSASKAGFITGFYVPLVPFFQMFVFENGRVRIAWPRPMEGAGIVVATIGLALLTFPEGETLTWSAGDLLVGLATIAFAIQILLISHYGRQVRFESLTVIQIASGALAAMLSFPVIDHPVRASFTGPVWVALTVGAVFATAFAFGVQSWAQQHTTPTRVALIFALEPVFAWVTAFLVAGETLSLRAAAGGVSILAGILLVELKPTAPPGHPLEQAGEGRTAPYTES